MPVRLRIDRLGHRGDGIAIGPTGAPIYIPRMLPGEEIEAEIEGDRGRFARIIVPSEDRVRAPCKHYSACGGCSLQHLAEPAVADWKRAVVAQALASQGIQTGVVGPDTSPGYSRRRATFALKRTKGGALVGFHGAASHTVVDTPECHLLHPDLLAVRPALARLAELGASRKQTLSARVTCLDHGVDVSVTGGKPLSADQHARIAAICADARILRLTWEGEPVAQLARPKLTIAGISVTPPPGSFLQATAAGETALQAAVLDAVGPARQVVDLFAGLGTFSLPLAAQAEVHAVEGEAAMTAALADASRAGPGLKRVSTETRDLFRRPLEPDELARFDAAVIDPPRAGALAQTERLAESRVPRIAAVSCNPQTFARDARRLVDAGYRVEWVRVVDQFRWSPHVELAAFFALEHTSS
ncbi:MAG: class I SAM-dependent RNA methyltransferase [Pseudomonadota bacterium]